MVDIYAAQFSRSPDDFGQRNNREIEIGFTTENYRDSDRFYRSNLDANYWQRQNDVLVRNGTLPMTEIGQQNSYNGGIGRYRDGEVAPGYYNRSEVQGSLNRVLGNGNDLRISGGVSWGGGDRDRYVSGDVNGYGNRGSEYGRNDRYHRPGHNMGHDGRCSHHGRGSSYGGVADQYNMRGGPSDFENGYANGGRYSDVQEQNMRYREQYLRDFRSRQAEAIERAYEQKYNRFNNGYRGGPTREMGAPDGPNVPNEVVPQRDPNSPQPNRQQDSRLYHNDLPPTPPGYEEQKWDNPDHLTTKYVVGRAVAADLLPALRNVPQKADRANIAEQYWRQNRGLIERDGSSVLGFSGEKMLIRDQQGKVFIADTVISLGVQDQMRPGWELTDDPRKINVNDFHT